MAKKQTFNFSDISKLLKTSIEKTSVKIVDKEDGEFISTGIYILDALLSSYILNGGIQSNRITAFAGESATGKSYLCYNIAREAQKKGQHIFYIDTERSIDKGRLAGYGINTDEEHFTLINTSVVEDIKIMLTKFIDGLKEMKEQGELPKMMIFLDSIGQLASRKEINDALDGKEKADMTRAKAIASLFRIINSDLGYLNIPMIVTNHTYLSQDLFPKEIMKGGTGLFYSASSIVFLSKAKLKEGDEDELSLGQSGIVVTAKAKKNRLAIPKQVKFNISFESGSNPYVGLDYFCTAENFEKVGLAKGKMEVNKSTGEMKFVAGGNFQYSRDLGRKVTKAELFTPDVFNDRVLKELNEIAHDYFRFKTFDEQQQFIKEQDEEFTSVNVNDLDIFEDED